MKFTAETAAITFSGGNFSWGGCFSENGLYIILEVSGDEDAPAIKTGKMILDQILIDYSNTGKTDGSLIKKTIQDLKDNKHIVSLSVGILVDDLLHLGSIGFSEILLRRGDKVGVILKSDSTAVGKVLDNDLLFAVTKKFCTLIDESTRLNYLLQEDFHESAEEGIQKILEKEDKDGVAGLFIRLSKNLADEVFDQKVPSVETFRNSLSKLDWIKDRLKLLLNKSGQDIEDPEISRSKRRLLSIAVVLIVFLFFSIFLNINKNVAENKKKHLTETLDLVNHQYEEAKSLVDLNPVRARSLLADTKLSLGSLIKEFPPKSDETKLINEWLGKISEEEVAAYKIYKLTTVPLFFDISLIKTNGKGDKIAGYKNNMAILDKTNRVVYSLFADSKQTSIVAGPETVREAESITIHGTKVYIANSEGIVMIDIPSKSSSVAVKTDKEWGHIRALDSYGGNLYLLDSANSGIWKYIATDTGFTNRQSYLNIDTKTDLSQATDMVIDGSVWVLDREEDLIKFSRGVISPFGFNSFAETFHKIPAFSTGDTVKYLYILDTSGGRIVVFDKDGTYQSQYQWDELENSTDLYVSEDDRKIYILSGSKIYAIDIK